MNLKNERELEVTREKLKMLEDQYQIALKEPSENAYLRELTLRSYKRHINQLKEEIIRFEAHAVKR